MSKAEVYTLHNYEMEMYCANCNKAQKEKIPKGTLSIAHNWTCNNCGCTKEQFDEYHKRHHGRPGVVENLPTKEGA